MARLPPSRQFGLSSLTVNNAAVLALSAVTSNVSSEPKRTKFPQYDFMWNSPSHHVLPIGNERAGFIRSADLMPGSETSAPMLP
jgi:hypothetical protein